MKVLLVSFYNTEAYGVRSLHASLVALGTDAHMLFFKTEEYQYDKALRKNFSFQINEVTEKEIELCVSHIKKGQPNLLAFSLVSSHFHLYMRIWERIKYLGIPVILGGWEPSLNPDRCVKVSDFICIGEGEQVLQEVVARIDKGQSVSDIQNICFNSSHGIVYNPVRPLNKNISHLPIPIFDKERSCVIENDSVSYIDPYMTSTRYGTFIGLGCPYHCTYCSNYYMVENVYGGDWSKSRYHSVERMKAEFQEVKRKLPLINRINFYDEVFSPDLSWVRKFFAWYKEEINIPFCCTFYPGKCSYELCNVLVDAGMVGVWLGVQSGSKRVREEVFKRFYTNEKVLEQADIFFRHGISARYDFIFDNPFETFEESLESIRLMLQFPQPFSINPFSLKYFPNTGITKMALQKGIITQQNVDDEYVNSQDTYLVSDNRGTIEQQFINNLVMYVNSQASLGLLNDAFVEQIISSFLISQDLKEVRELVKESWQV